MQKITGAMALHLIRNAVELKGSDYVYTNPAGFKGGEVDDEGTLANCYYLHEVEQDGETKHVPGCIIGHVAKKMGVEDLVLEQEENNTSDALMDSIMVLTNDAHETLFEVTELAKRLFRTVQRKQDKGETWGEAYAAAQRDYVNAKMTYITEAQRDYLNKIDVF